MRSATVVVTRRTIAMVAVLMGMRHAISMSDDFPMLEGMGDLGNSQQRQAGQPKHPEATLNTHKKPK